MRRCLIAARRWLRESRAFPGWSLVKPRQPRPDLANVPQHVVQRGNDRQPCFFTVANYPLYLTNLREAALRYDVAIHVYVLMTNHVHLLATPAEAGGISGMMQFLGRQYVPYVNCTYRRTGEKGVRPIFNPAETVDAAKGWQRCGRGALQKQRHHFPISADPGRPPLRSAIPDTALRPHR